MTLENIILSEKPDTQDHKSHDSIYMRYPDIDRDSELVRGCLGLGREEWKGTVHGDRFPFGMMKVF